MNPLEQLTEFGQSPWLDNISRDLLDSGGLSRLVVDDGIRGVTSNPTIFDQAISKSATYDTAIAAFPSDDPAEIFWDLAITDVQRGCDVLRPLYDQTDGGDGFVSLEVDPNLAYEAEATITMAKDLHDRVGRPNLLIKIPGTAAGLQAIEEAIAAGISVNVTLLFAIERHMEAADAYLRGLRRAQADGADLARISSVASFFVSRVDTLVDEQLEAIGTDEALALRGKAAVANAKLAYQAFLERFSGDGWDQLAASGARYQRPLWASTSTKNPAYDDTLYVSTLIGEHTVNTMPDTTIEAFCDHGVVDPTLVQGVDEARTVMERLAAVGIDMDAVTAQLEAEGVQKFAKSFSDLLASVGAKRAAVTSRS